MTLQGICYLTAIGQREMMTGVPMRAEWFSGVPETKGQLPIGLRYTSVDAATLTCGPIDLGAA